jgi:hypothetical protein
MVLLDMTHQEKLWMINWYMMPARFNTTWWNTYMKYEADVRAADDEAAKNLVLSEWEERIKDPYMLWSWRMQQVHGDLGRNYTWFWTRARILSDRN